MEIDERVSLLLVDTGENIEAGREEIFHCPSHFQVDHAVAVPCSLSRVTPFHRPTWSKEAGDFLYEMTRAEDTDQPFPINCSAYSTKSGGYQVSLTIAGEKDLDLAGALVKQGYAKWSLKAVESSSV